VDREAGERVGVGRRQHPIPLTPASLLRGPTGEREARRGAERKRAPLAAVEPALLRPAALLPQRAATGRCFSRPRVSPGILQFASQSGQAYQEDEPATSGAVAFTAPRIAARMSGAQVTPMVDAAEGERENMIDCERIAGAGGLAAEPAGMLLGQHLQAEGLVGAGVAACHRAATAAGALSLLGLGSVGTTRLRG
jgi:hypothetical protein